MKALLYFILISTARFPQGQEFHKYPEIGGNEYMSTLFCCVYVGKFLHNLKSYANGIRAICHFFAGLHSLYMMRNM